VANQPIISRRLDPGILKIVDCLYRKIILKRVNRIGDFFRPAEPAGLRPGIRSAAGKLKLLSAFGEERPQL
jgi:hypothetical protein